MHGRTCGKQTWCIVQKFCVNSQFSIDAQQHGGGGSRLLYDAISVPVPIPDYLLKLFNRILWLFNLFYNRLAAC